MQGKTHITLGIATGILVMQPQSVPEVMIATIGGVLGGTLPDIDIKKADTDREYIYDGIVDSIAVAVLIILDALIGNGACQYVYDNWGPVVWCAMAALIVLAIIGFSTSHRSFTHSFLAIGLFGASMYFLCRPAFVPFVSGYASHILIDLLNKKGMKLLFPLKKRFSFNLCYADQSANEVFFSLFLGCDMVLVSVYFLKALVQSIETSQFAALMRDSFCGTNWLYIYLVIINLISLIAWQLSWRYSYREWMAEENSDKDMEKRLDFETWLLNILVFVGGGLGAILILIIHRNRPAEYNSNRWAFCYASVVFWATVISVICNPLGLVIGDICWTDERHLYIAIYLAVINLISLISFLVARNTKVDEYSYLHTFLIFLGAIGGTFGAIPVVALSKKKGSYYYAVSGFYLMMAVQIMLIGYLMMCGII